MAQFVVKMRKTTPEEQTIEAETPEAAVESVVVASEEAADGSTIEILQVTPAPAEAPPAEAPVEAPAEEPATA